MSINNPIAVLVVGICAAVSWSATASLLVFTAWLFIIAHRKPDGTAKSKVRFLRTQFGVLFINILIMDLVQSTAFALNFYWYGESLPPSLASNTAACRSQGIFIQAADIGFALFSVSIAFHTAAFIIWRARPSTRLFVGLIVIVWTLVIVATIAGPAHAALLRATSDPVAPLFYDAAGLWCWISSEYDAWRLYAHYLWVFISAVTSLAAYIAVFLFIWFRLFRRSAYSLSWLRLRKAVDRELLPNLGEVEKQAPAATDTMNDRDKTLDKAALTMLLYPISYLCCITPLATYRLGRMANASWAANNPNLQAACGCLFTLNGLCNVVLYVSTRHVYRGDKTLAAGQFRGVVALFAVSIDDGTPIETLCGRDSISYKMMIDAGIVRPNIDYGRRESHTSISSKRSNHDSPRYIIGLPAKTSVSRRPAQNASRRPSAISSAFKLCSDGLSIDLSSDEEQENKDEDERPEFDRSDNAAWQPVTTHPVLANAVHHPSPLPSQLPEVPPALTQDTKSKP